MATFVTTTDAILLERADAGSAKLGTVARNTSFEGDELPTGFVETKEAITVKKGDGTTSQIKGFLISSILNQS
jgi:hypothetical protein